MPRIGNVNALLSVNTSEFSAGLNRAADQLAQFGRKVSDSFGRNLPNMGQAMFGGEGLSAIEKEMRAMQEAPRSMQALQSTSISASHSIKALSGSLFLLTGQSGFFVVEAARAASHVAKLAKECGGLGAAIVAVGTSMRAMLAALGPVGIALIAAAGAYEVFSRVINSGLEKTNERMQKFLDLAKGMEHAVAARRKHALLLGSVTPFESRVLELEDAGLSRDMAERTAMIEADNDALERGIKLNQELAAAETRRAEEFARVQKASQEENNKVIKEAAARQQKFEEDIARARDQAFEEAQKKAVQILGGSMSQFETNPILRTIMQFDEAINALRNKGDKIGASFGVSSMSFRGNAPTGDVFGQQREQAKTNEHLEEIEELNRRLVNFVESNGLGVTLN